MPHLHPCPYQQNGSMLTPLLGPAYNDDGGKRSLNAGYIRRHRTSLWPGMRRKGDSRLIAGTWVLSSPKSEGPSLRKNTQRDPFCKGGQLRTRGMRASFHLIPTSCPEGEQAVCGCCQIHFTGETEAQRVHLAGGHPREARGSAELPPR